MSFLRLFALGLLALGLCISEPASAQDFLKSGIKMGTIGCPETDYSCKDVMSQQADIVSKANTCIKDLFSMHEPIMSSISMSGEYENCVLPSKAHKNEADRNVWAICCLKKIEGEEDLCSLFCTRYITPK